MIAEGVSEFDCYAMKPVYTDNSGLGKGGNGVIERWPPNTSGMFYCNKKSYSSLKLRIKC